MRPAHVSLIAIVLMLGSSVSSSWGADKLRVVTTIPDLKSLAEAVGVGGDFGPHDGTSALEQGLAALGQLPESRDRLAQAIDLRFDLRNALGSRSTRSPAARRTSTRPRCGRA